MRWTGSPFAFAAWNHTLAEPDGFEPPIRKSKSRALPLGHGPVYAAGRRISRQRLQTKSHLFAAAPRRSQAPQASATFKGLEPPTGLEPAPSAWKAEVLPLHHGGIYRPRRGTSTPGTSRLSGPSYPKGARSLVAHGAAVGVEPTTSGTYLFPASTACGILPSP